MPSWLLRATVRLASLLSNYASSSPPFHRDPDSYLSGSIFCVQFAAIQRKRPLSEPEDMFERFKRSKTVMDAPSTVGQRSAYESLQRDPSQKIFDDRPEPDPKFAPGNSIYNGECHVSV